MRNLSIAAIALVAFATPAAARDGALYVGVEGGVWLPRDTNYQVTSTRVQTVPIGQGLLGQTVTTSVATFGSGFVSDYKRGYDVDVIAGYDFGFIRLEGELAYKRAKLRDLTGSTTLVGGINTAPISGVTPGSFNFGNNRTSVASAMANALIDFGIAPGFSIYGGGGFGQARVKTLGGRDNVYAGQLIGGLSTAISENVELGVKYRYFQTRKVRFNTSSSFTGTGGSTSVSQFANEGKLRSHSVLASLIFNFGGTSEALPPPPPPVEVAPVVEAPPPPATQTCPDGSVILATDVCPAPPPPPPPPAPTQERG